jgi:hypothetical protein
MMAGWRCGSQRHGIEGRARAFASEVIDLLDQAIAAHGGRDLWASANEVAVRISSGGLAFATKLQGSAVRDVEARVSTRDQHVVFSPYPRPGERGVLTPDGSVRIETDAGGLVEERVGARAAFGDLRHKLRWDKLDILYFGAYAIWTYISAPFVFAQDGYEVREIEPWEENNERWRRLAVRFPEGVQTHSRDQVFYFDGDGLIRRHDYTAEPLGSWANAAHYCFEHRVFDDLIVPTRRRVFPRLSNNRRLSRPLLVWIEVKHAALRR